MAKNSRELRTVVRTTVAEQALAQIRELVESGGQPHYVSMGHLIYGHGSQALMGVPFDADAGERTGDPIVLLPSLAVYSGAASQFAVSETGTLIYDAGGIASTGVQLQLVEVDTSGVEIPLPISPSGFRDPRYSPDGSQIAYEDLGDIRIYSFATGATPLIALGRTQRPVWSASGLGFAHAP